MTPPEIISTKTSLDGVKDLYLIIVGIGITESLMHIKDIQEALQWFGYFILLAGFLVTIFRFSLGIINLLNHVSTKVHPQWSEAITLVCLAFLACALCFFAMGINLNTIEYFLIALLGLLICHWAALFLCHKPWSFPRGWGFWMLEKTLCILFRYPLGRYDPQYDTVRYWPMTSEQKLIKASHYQWIRSDFWLGVILLVMLLNQVELATLIPTVVTTLPPEVMNRVELQILSGLLLMAFTVWDIRVNRAYYFASERESEELNL